MKIIKHLFWVAKGYINRITCKHKESRFASCPFTGNTYELCTNCMKYLSVKETNG